MTPLRLVLDTNTILALWMFQDPRLAPLRTQLENDPPTLLTRADALEELRRVLAYRQFALEAPVQTQLWTEFQARATVLDPSSFAPEPPLPPCRDPDDQKFLEIAGVGRADALLTRDKALLRLARHRLIRERFAILTPEVWQTQSGANLPP